MTSFMSTMFVHNSPPQPYSPSPKPLPALHTDVLAQAEAAGTPPPYLASPQSVYQSPLQRHIQDVLGAAGGGMQQYHHSPLSPRGQQQYRAQHHHQQQQHQSAIPVPVPARQEDRQHATHRPKAAAAAAAAAAAMEATSRAAGWAEMVKKPVTDLFTRSNSNARTRHNNQQASFQPQKRAKGSQSWQLKQFAEATLGSGSLRKVVRLPEGEDRDEWLAVNGIPSYHLSPLIPMRRFANVDAVVDFYNQLNLLYGSITEFCSPTTCPEMKATDEFEYLWHDPPAFPRPTHLPAPVYISHLLSWTSNHLSNPALFPTAPGVPFPPEFEKTVKTIFKRLYRVYAHIYCHHYGVVRGLGLEAHLNTGFKHYVLFVEEFGLADEGKNGSKRAEWFGPLGELVESMLRSD
jgi:MOB kinase activator 1